MGVIGRELERILREFEENTEGVLGSSIIYSPQALMVAEASSGFEREIVQAMSMRLLQMADQVLKELLKTYTMQKVLIEENDHFIYLRPINEDYYLTVITQKVEALGILEHNLKVLIDEIRESMAD